MEQRAIDAIVRYGPPLLFAAQMFGIFGVPIPDELLLTIAGVLVRRGQLSMMPTTLAAISGCIVGVTLSYVLGRTFGVSMLRRLFRRHEDALHRAQRGFERLGCWILAFGYYIPGVRHVTAITAGSMPLSFRRFAEYAYPGAVLWCATFVGLGYLAGDRWRDALESARSHGSVIASAALVLAFAYVAWMHDSRKAMNERARSRR